MTRYRGEHNSSYLLTWTCLKSTDANISWKHFALMNWQKSGDCMTGREIDKHVKLHFSLYGFTVIVLWLETGFSCPKCLMFLSKGMAQGFRKQSPYSGRWDILGKKNIHRMFPSKGLPAVNHPSIILLKCHDYTLRKFRRYNKATLGELVPLEILGKH